MFLKKKELVTSELRIDISFEKVADDLLMISLSNQVQNQGLLSYWRLTKVVGIPPLEIGIDCKEGLISSITFFVDGLTVKKGDEIEISLSEGNILIDNSFFVNENEYIDVEQTYDIYCSNNKLICSFVETKEFIKAFRNDRVEIFVDCYNQIVGLAICDLSDKEKELIDSIQKG